MVELPKAVVHRVQFRPGADTVWTSQRAAAHHSRVRVLTHIARLSDCFGFFDVRITCVCGGRREIDARELAARVGWLSLAEVQQRMRCSKCGKKGAAEVVAVAQPR